MLDHQDMLSFVFLGILQENTPRGSSCLLHVRKILSLYSILWAKNQAHQPINFLFFLSLVQLLGVGKFVAKVSGTFDKGAF
jgi:hypothetical protein